MSDSAYADFTEQVLSLSYEQTIILMGKMLESLKNKRNEENYAEMENEQSEMYVIKTASKTKKNFLELAGKIHLDSNSVTELREASLL
mgnify:CR=1 FL=1